MTFCYSSSIFLRQVFIASFSISPHLSALTENKEGGLGFIRAEGRALKRLEESWAIATDVKCMSIVLPSLKSLSNMAFFPTKYLCV